METFSLVNIFKSWLMKIAETACKLGILVVADEVYDHFAFGDDKPFVSMADFAEIVPVILLGPIPKRWFVPGWRLGWMVTLDPHSILKDSGFVQTLTNVLNVSKDPATFIQGAIPDIIGNTKEEFFSLKLGMVKLNLSLLEDISDNLDFCSKLAKEESVITLPGQAVGLENWLHITFAVELELLVDGLSRLKNFAERHSKKQP